jgi:hypothetical protein
MSQFYYDIATGRVGATTGRTLNASIFTGVGLTLDPDPSARFLDGPAETIAMYSDDSRDNAAGDGMRRMLIFGLDENFEFQAEYLLPHATDGTIPVHTVKTYKRIAGAVSMQAGLVSNIGTITFEMSGGLWLGAIQPNEGRLYLDTYTIPAGHVASITLVRYHVEKLAGKDGEVSIHGRVRGAEWPNGAWNGTFSGFIDTLTAPHVVQRQPIPYQYNEKTDLLMDFHSTDKDLRVFLDLVVIEELGPWGRSV